MRTCVSLIKVVTLNKDLNAALQSITVVQSSETSEVWVVCVIKIIKSGCLGCFFLMGMRFATSTWYLAAILFTNKEQEKIRKTEDKYIKKGQIFNW